MYRFIAEGGQHLHTLDGKPLIGTSTVVGVLSKPLTWWASGLAVETLGWLKKADPRKSTPHEVTQNTMDRAAKASRALDDIRKMTVQEYVALLDKAYRAHADSLTKSADKGTDMHAELEHYVKDCIANHQGVPQNTFVGSVVVATFRDWAVANVKRFIASEAHCYSERLWTGGITDCIFEDKEGRVAIMDFKSSKEAYLSQFIQAAGYDIEITENGILDENGVEIAKVEQEISYYAIFPFGMAKPEPQFRFDTAALKKGFESCVSLYKLQNTN